MIEIEFGDLDAARKIRENPKYRGFLDASDHGGRKTVKLLDNTPDPAVAEITGEAAESKSYKAEQYGQAQLTREEKKRIDFSKTNILAARSAKAIALGKGVSDFSSYFDEELSVDEHREVFERAARESRDIRVGRTLDDERELNRRLARGSQIVKGQELNRAKDFAFDGDDAARSFVRDAGASSDIFDITFNQTSSGIRGAGEDFDRLLDIHEERPERAQYLDERKNAPITRDPFEWMDNPSRFDFPGVDTVDPVKLHSQRSKRARQADERELAPITTNKELWAFNPDEYDFPGVDTPDDYQPEDKQPFSFSLF